MKTLKEKIDEIFAKKVFIVRNPNRRKKIDQYNVRVLLFDDVLKVLQLQELQEQETAKEIIQTMKTDFNKGKLKCIDVIYLEELKQKFNKRKMNKKKLKVTIEWKLLERIAEYYSFPSVVFLGNMKMFPNPPKTREEGLLKTAEVFKKIKDIMDEFDYAESENRKDKEEIIKNSIKVKETHNKFKKAV